MEHKEQIRIIEGLINHLDNGSNEDVGYQVKNPVSAYICDERAKQEWDQLFQNYPQVLGLSNDLPENGTFFTNDDLGKPVLCTRTKKGTFKAFLNVCTHRGTLLETEKNGKKSVFSCRFHAWGFSTNGDLVSVPKEDHFGTVDKSCMSLVELPAVEKYGLLWVCLDQSQKIDVDDLLGDLAEEFSSWELDKLLAQGEEVFDHDMNWKLATDTFGETYHFQSLHKNTLANDFYGNVQMYDTYKRNHRMSLCMKSIEQLRDMPKEEWRIGMASLPVYFIFPNTIINMIANGPIMVRAYPKGPDAHHSYSRVNYYINKDVDKMMAEAGRAEENTIENRMQGFGSIINNEDYVAAASSHIGAMSGAIDYFTFGRNEPALHHYHNTFNEALGLPALEKV